MKKIFIITALICSTIFVVGCGQNKQSNQENNSTTAETQQENNSSTTQNNSNNKDSNTETTNSQNDVVNQKNNDTIINKKDYYTKKLDDIQAKIDKDYNFENTKTTSDMRHVSGAQYKLWDDALNEMYKDLQNTLSSNDKENLKEEELSWISKKENDAQKKANEVKGGTLEPVYYALSSVDSTKKRCYELVNKYMH